MRHTPARASPFRRDAGRHRALDVHAGAAAAPRRAWDRQAPDAGRGCHLHQDGGAAKAVMSRGTTITRKAPRKTVVSPSKTRVRTIASR